MATKRFELAPCAPLTPDLKAVLGPPPLLDSEDIVVFDAVYDRVRSELSPRDFVEEIWVRGIVDAFLETVWLRRAKVKFLRASAREGLAKLMPLLTVDCGISVKSLVENWGKRARSAVNYVEALLKDPGLDQETIEAETLVLNLDTVERIDRRIMQAESRYNTTLREIDRRRDGAAQRLRDFATQIEDAEFREIPSVEAAE
jgi:hypothetical protein